MGDRLILGGYKWPAYPQRASGIASGNRALRTSSYPAVESYCYGVTRLCSDIFISFVP